MAQIANPAARAPMELGMVRVAAVAPRLKVAEPSFNKLEIANMITLAESNHVGVALFPELCLTGYTCADLFHQEQLWRGQSDALEHILKISESVSAALIIGLYARLGNHLYNCAAVIQNGRIMGVTPKSYIPNSKEYYERRWFSPARAAHGARSINLLGAEIPFGHIIYHDHASGFRFGVEVCEDLWAPVALGALLSLNGAHVIFNPSASNEIVGKREYRRDLVKQASSTNVGGYVYASAGVHESSTDLVFSGHCLVAENGTLLAETGGFERESAVSFADIDFERIIFERSQSRSMEDCAAMLAGSIDTLAVDVGPLRTLTTSDTLVRSYHATPFVPPDDDLTDMRCEEIFSIQSSGLAKRLEHTGAAKTVVGVSGGLDSTLALLVCAVALRLLGRNPSDLIAVTMPGFGTTDTTKNNAMRLAGLLCAELRIIPISQAVTSHFADIGHDPKVHDHTYENAQARERTQILMDIANSENGLVIGTGDLSEAALGWATYNGDHMSMYAVNASIPKTLIRFVIKWVMRHRIGGTIDEPFGDDAQELRQVLESILETPISPELLPPDETGAIKQKTEETIGPYVLHDFFLYYTIRYGMRPLKLAHIAARAFKDIYEEKEIQHWLKVFYKRFFAQQFKRSCVPDGPKVGTVSLSPRGDWRMPSDASADAWLDEL